MATTGNGSVNKRKVQRRRHNKSRYPPRTTGLSDDRPTTLVGWRSLLNQMSEEEQKEFEKIHREEISEVLGDDGVWFNTEVLIAVGEKP